MPQVGPRAWWLGPVTMLCPAPLGMLLPLGALHLTLTTPPSIVPLVSPCPAAPVMMCSKPFRRNAAC